MIGANEVGAARMAVAPVHGWPAEVARYYDRNTRRFLLVGRGRGAHAIHRELWAPGVDSRTAAVEQINHVLAEEIAAVAAVCDPTILDFGCGVGGTLFHLARRFPSARLTGVTVSAHQVERAERLARKLRMEARCSFVWGDFQSADVGARVDVVVAVESFVHADRSDAFLANATRHLKPGGILIVADDFLAIERTALDARQRLLVERLRSGWRAPGVCTVDRLVSLARAVGLRPEKTVDLTSWTRPGSRKRDRVLAAVGPLMGLLGLGRIPFYGNMIGGNALQAGLREGFLRYQLVVLRRAA